MSKCSSPDTLHHYILGYICQYCGDSSIIKQEVKTVSAREAAEIVETLEKAIETLEDCKEFEQENIQSSWRKRYWQRLGEGGATLEALRLIRDRLRERGN